MALLEVDTISSVSQICDKVLLRETPKTLGTEASKESRC